MYKVLGGLDMGLYARALRCDTSYSRSYSGFDIFRTEIAEVYSEKFKQVYMYEGRDAAREVCKDEGLIIFLYHSDCEGSLLPKECKVVYESLMNLKEHINTCHIEVSDGFMDQLDIWLELTRHCYKERVRLLFR